MAHAAQPDRGCRHEGHSPGTRSCPFSGALSEQAWHANLTHSTAAGEADASASETQRHCRLLGTSGSPTCTFTASKATAEHGCKPPGTNTAAAETCHATASTSLWKQSSLGCAAATASPGTPGKQQHCPTKEARVGAPCLVETLGQRARATAPVLRRAG